MNWLEDAKTIYAEMEALESEKNHRLLINKDTKIPDNLSGIEFVSLQHDYEDSDPIDLLSSIISKAPFLKTIHITKKISWADVCNLNLSQIEELSFSLDGTPDCASINAPALKSLTIFSEANLTPIELLMASTPHIEFSGMPNLEKLDLRHFQLVSTDDFHNLHNLKSLTITDSTLDNLSWLSDAKYSLKYLYIDGELDDCSGITSQPELATVLLLNTFLKDVSPLEHLPNLKHLDLRYGNINSEGNLRALNLDELLITRNDGNISSIRRSVRSLVRFSVIRTRSEEKQLDKINEMPEFRKKLFLRRIQQPFEERMKRNITDAYKTDLERFTATDYHILPSLSRDEYISIYKRLALEYCPFLESESL